MSHLAHRHLTPAIPPWIVKVLVLVFAGLTIVRGIGYLTGEPSTSIPLVAMAALRDPDVWGVLTIVAGSLIVLAYISRLHVAVWAAHGLAAVLYAGLTVALGQAAFDYGAGWQNVGPVAGGLAWHSLLAWLTGPLPSQTPRGDAGGSD